MPRVFDQDGNNLGLNPGESGGVPRDDWSFGASLWELFNPSQVQAEDAAIGAKPRTYEEIFGDAFGGIMAAGEETREQVVQESKATLDRIGTPLLIGVVAVAVIAVLTRGR